MTYEPKGPPVVARTDAGWLLPALFAAMGAPVLAVGGWMAANGGIGTGATVGVFGLGFLLLALRLALETGRARIEVRHDLVFCVTPWWRRRLAYETLEELAVEEVETIDKGESTVRRFYSLRPHRRRGFHFSSAWSGSEAVAEALEARGVKVDKVHFRIDRDAERRELDNPDRPWLGD